MLDYEYIRAHIIRSNQRSDLRSFSAQNYTFKPFACYSFSKAIFTKLYGRSFAKIKFAISIAHGPCFMIRINRVMYQAFYANVAEYTSDSVSGGASIYWYLRQLMFVIQRNLINTYSHLVTSIVSVMCTLTWWGLDKWPLFPRQYFPDDNFC